MDRRQQKTRNAIFAAFNDLLFQKSYNKITVQDIIDTANVGRTTFYAHFETKDDLLREMCDDLFQHIISTSLEGGHYHLQSVAATHPQEITMHILDHLKDNRKNIIGILSCESSELFLRYFREYLNRLVSGWLDAGAVRPCEQISRDFLVNHISGSFVNMVQWWMRNGLKQSTEELASYFFFVIGPLLSRPDRAPLPADT